MNSVRGREDLDDRGSNLWKGQELKEDLRADATMDEIGSALVQPVNVRWIDKPRNRNAEGGFAGLASPPWVGGREQRRQGEGESSGAPADGEVTRDYVLRRSVKRPRLSKVDRGFWVLLRRIWTDWESVLVIVKPETVIRWSAIRVPRPVPKLGPFEIDHKSAA